MRISRRPAAAAVVLGVSLFACYEQGVHLSSTGEELVVFMPTTSYDFGTVPLGQPVATNPDPYFTVRAQGAFDDDQVTVVKSATCGTDFTLDLQPPLPNMPAHVYCSGSGSGSGTGTAAGRPETGSVTPTCTYVDYHFGAKFTPSQPGMQTCPVTVTSSPSGGGAAMQYTITLTGTGQGATFAMDVQPKTLLDFGDVPLNTATGNQPVTVVNNGTSSIDVTSSNTDTTHFIANPLFGGAPVTIPPQGFHTFQVHCQAGATPALYTATFSFSTGPTQGSLAGSVSAQCNATAANVTVSPNPIDLGTHLLGDATTTQQLTITNRGSAAVTLASFALPGAPTDVTFPGGDPGTFIIAAGMQLLLNVQYAPTTERDVGPMGTMQFDASGTTVNTPLRGGAHIGSLGTNPGMFEFGTVCAGSMKSLDVSVFANAGGDVTLGGVTTPGSPFAVSLPGTGRTLLGHHGTEIALTGTASPAVAETPGDKTDMATLQTNIPNMTTVAIPMHAVVLAGGVAPTPMLSHFGPNELGKPSAAQMISVTNCSTADFTISDASFTGANLDEFTIVSPADPHVMIKQTQSAAFLVVMTARSAGPKSAQLVFTYPAGTATVDLDGTGIGSSDTGGAKDRETYYACSAGGAPGMLPIALAAFAARRRRSKARRARIPAG